MSIKRFVLFSIVLVSFSAAAAAQEIPADDEDAVVRVSTQVVQVDAVVTDKDGEQVTDLNAGDFEVLQDGKPREILAVKYIDLSDPRSRPAVSKLKKGKNVPAIPGRTVAVEDAGRILTFVVDDGNCAVSRIGIRATREALVKFISEQMQPNDLVAIYQTRTGSSAMQQYTSDRSKLLELARKIRWYPPSGACPNDGTGDFYDPERQNLSASLYADENIPETDPTTDIIKPNARIGQEAAAQRDSDRQNDRKVRGLVGVLAFVARGLQRVSGRKTVFLMSDGLPLQAIGPNGRLSTGDQWQQVLELIDMANRASIVFNTIDIRGVVNPDIISANDDFTAPSGGTLSFSSTNRTRSDRQNAIIAARSGLHFLADETGGTFYHDQNYLDKPIGTALANEKGYYLIAYDPGDDAFKGRKYNQIKINVRTPGLNVKARSGFMSLTDEAVKPKHETEAGDLYEALISPLPTAGLELHLTAFFNSPDGKNSVRSLVFLNGEELAFTPEGKDNAKAAFDVVAVTFDGKNKIVDEFYNTYTVKIPSAYVAAVKQKGLSFLADVPVKKPGVYTFRIAIRDVNSRLIGSAGREVLVPNLKDKDIFISGLTVAVADDKGRFIFVPGAEMDPGFTAVASMSDPSVRKFSPGEILAYSYNIFNAADDEAARSGILAQVIIYRNGEVFVRGEREELKADNSAGRSGQKDFGYMRIAKDADPGDYALQVLLWSKSGKLLTSEWIDYQIVDP